MRHRHGRHDGRPRVRLVRPARFEPGSPGLAADQEITSSHRAAGTSPTGGTRPS
jgi:hypothetical protein